MADGSLSRRELLRRSGEAGALLALPVVVARRSAAEAQRPHRRCPAPAGRLRRDRRAAADQRARHVHDHQRLDDAARGAGGDGRGRRALRAPRRADRGDRRAPGRADRRRVGARDARLLGRADPRHRRLRRRRQPRPARPHPEPAGFAKTRSIIPKHSRNVYDAAMRAVGVRVVKVSTVAELEAAFGPRTALSTCWPARGRRERARRQGDRADRQGQERARPRRRRRRDPDRPQRPPAERRRRSSPTAAASACAVRRRPACCSAARTWSRRPGSTARRITAPRAATRSARKKPSGC